MALTPEEMAELRQLEAQEASYQDSVKGGEAANRVVSARVKPAKPTSRPFSVFRATVGGLRDAAQNILDFSEEAGDALQRRLPLPIVRFGGEAGNGIIDVVTGQESIDYANKTKQLPVIGGLKGEENAGTAEGIVRSIVSFAAPFSLWSKTFGITKAVTWLDRAGRATLAGAAVDFTADPEHTNLANTIRSTFNIDNATLDALASEEDDNRLYSRFKAAAVNAPLGILGDAVFEAGFMGLKAYRGWKGSVEEASAAVKAAREDVPVQAPAVLDEAAEASEGAAKATTQAAEGETFDAARHVATEKPPETFEDILDFLQRKTAAGATDLDIENFARTLTEGDPENALSKLGIDPLKIDYSAFDDPEMLTRLHKGLSEVYEGIAQRLGRSGVRVTEEATASAARTMATTADVLKDLYGRTENLAETMMASRLFVGAHAQKLLGQAQKAIAALKSGAGDAEWMEFLETFHRQAYFLGALRGAGSEVGRALRQLQIIGKVGRKTAQRDFKAAVKKEAEQSLFDPKAVAEQAGDAVSALLDPAERIMFLGRLVEKSGDIGDLSRFTRTKSGSVLRRLDTATGETRGNLFSSATAALNVLSGMTFMGLNAASKALAGVVRMSLSPFGKNHSMAARVQLMESWGYVDATLGAWRDAYRNTLALLEREGMKEVAINLDSIGAKGLAGKAAGLAEEGASREAGHFERVDIDAHERAFAMTPADIRHLDGIIEQWDTPKLLEHSMKWLTRALAVPVNAAGSLSRLGTILFINAPDQLMGTIAAKAGAQAHAVRLAAQEAAELGLDGKALSTYLKARAVQLTDTVDGFADDAYSAGQREVALAHGDAEARAVLFQDQLEVGPLRQVASGMMRAPFFHLVVPFVRTPLRILERTAIDFTPLGFLKDRLRADVMAGGPRRDEALARIGLGTLAVYTAFQLAEDRSIIGEDSKFRSTARLSRGSYTLKVGDDLIEFNRLDPIGTLLGWGADLRAYLDDQSDNPEASNTALQIVEAAAVATSANMLSKTWLTSLRNLVDLAGDVGNKNAADGWGKFLASFATRFTPASGIQRSVSKGLAGADREASGVIEGLLKASLGSSTLPIKRDHILGRPVPVESGERLFGVRAGPGADDSDSPLLAELERLSFDIPAQKRSIKGVRMDSQQFSRFLELRGQVVRNGATGLTLEETLGKLIELPEYQALNRNAKVQAMRDEMRGFTRLATEQLLREDHGLAKRVLRSETWSAMKVQGATPEAMDAETERFARELGLNN